MLASAIAGAVGGAVSGVVVALVNAHLSRQQFVSNRLWDRKAEAYGELMRALARLRAVSERALESLETGSDPEPDQTERWLQARRALDDAIGQETFLLSADALAALENLRKLMGETTATSPMENPHTAIAVELEGIKDTARRLAPLARQDLGRG